MDSSQHEDEYTLDAIKAEIQSNRLHKDEIAWRLKEMISAEEAKPEHERDSELILICRQVLYEMVSGEPYVSRMEENRVKLLSKLEGKGKQKLVLRPVKRIGLVLAAMLVLLMAMEALLPHGWLYGVPSDDGQQYIIRGGEVNPRIVPEGVADESTENQSFRTDDFNEIELFLGYTPSLPQTLPDGWKSNSLYSVRNKGYKRFVAYYQKDDEEHWLQYEERVFNDPELAGHELEQNNTGRYETVGGKVVYLYQNMQLTGVMWSEGLRYYRISGHVSEEEIKNMID